MKIGDLVRRKSFSEIHEGRMFSFGHDMKLVGLVVDIREAMSPKIKRPYEPPEGQLYTITFLDGKTHTFPENFIELISEA
jgi:hypothetical protein